MNKLPEEVKREAQQLLEDLIKDPKSRKRGEELHRRLTRLEPEDLWRRYG
jgi:hypothetical protein